MTKKDSEYFINELANTFSEIKDNVLDEDWIGLISLQIGFFTKFTQQAIDTNTVTTITKCFQFVNDNIDVVEFKIENSLILSWLGKLNFDKNKTAYRLLPPKLKKLYTQLQEQYAKPLQNEKLNDFLNKNL